MIKGLGMDIVEVSKLKAAVDRWGERFLEKIYSAEERRYCGAKADPSPSFAVRFAAKEAMKKALSSLGLSGTPFHDIEVRLDSVGAPHLIFGRRLRLRLKNYKPHVSLSHHGEYATAMVILEKV